MSPRTRAIALAVGLISLVLFEIWTFQIHRWRSVTMPDGSTRVVVWPAAAANDAPYQAEIARALVRADLEADGWSLGFSLPFDPARPIPVDGRLRDATRLTPDHTWDDFPAISSDPAGGTWLAWISFNGQQDELRLARWYPEAGAWGAWNPVPTARGELWRPTILADATGVWVFWSQREGEGTDLFARHFDGAAWGPREVLGTSPGADLDPRAALGSDGSVHVVWQGFGDQSDIWYRVHRDHWSPLLRVSQSDANDWEPAVAVDSTGRAVVVWDSYAANHYDVMARTIDPTGTAGPVFPVADSPAYEARASVAIDDRDRIWFAWDRGPVAWAKDVGTMLPLDGRPRGGKVYDERRIEVRVLDGLSWWTPATALLDRVDRPPASNDNVSGEPIFHEPELLADRRGRIHLMYRQFRTQGRFSQYWTESITTMTAGGWAAPVQLPWSEGRIAMTGSLADGGDRLWLAWPRDNYPTVSTWMDLPDETLVENVYAAGFAIETPPGDDLVPYEPVAVEDPWDHEAERTAARRRRAPIQAAGQGYVLLRGDPHRHSDLSSDIRGVPDGSMLDAYRYFLDAGHLDWGALTDHQGGGDRVYWWWLSLKLADLYAVPGRFVPMYAYERSIGWPHGHRNVLFDHRGPSPIPIHHAGPTEQDYEDRHVWLRPHVFSERALEADTLYLYEELRRDDAVAIPHTTASSMGTDWRYHDPEVDVAVEIFQGKRYSYEHLGAPLTEQSEDYAAGMVHEAWKKGHRLGVVAASDHVSTHVSYGMVWAKEVSRAGVMEALRARRTYGATDDILLDVRIGEHLMGERFTAEGPVTISAQIRGTAPIARVVIFRDEQIATQTTPGRASADLEWTDSEVPPGDHRYYLRVEQEDGNLAWSSPFWVRIEGSARSDRTEGAPGSGAPPE